MPSVESTITAKLQQDPSIDTVVTLGAPFALTAVQSAKNAGSKAKIATFDTNAALVDAIQDGDVQWAVDQQPYLQGYLAIDSLWLYLNNGNLIGGGQADADRARPSSTSPTSTPSPNGQGRNSLDDARREHEMTTQADLDRRRPQGRPRRARQGTKPPAALADSTRDGRRDRCDRDLRLLLHRGAAVPRAAVAGHRAVRQLDHRHHGLRVAVLMIGGEFDLSAGVAVTFSSLAASMLAFNLHLNLWVGRGAGAGPGAGGRLPQRLPGDEDQDPQLPDHAEFVLHAGRHQPRGDQTGLGSGRHARASATCRAGTRRRRCSPRRSPSSACRIRITVLWWLLFTVVAT